MKFICSSCKAKYQIADEKVAGRAVRMKCRKCGHLIEISKAVTESSVSGRLPGASDPPQVLNSLPPVTAPPPARSSFAPAPLAPVGGARAASAPGARASSTGAAKPAAPSGSGRDKPSATPTSAPAATRSPLPSGTRSAPAHVRPSAPGGRSAPGASALSKPTGTAAPRASAGRTEPAARLGSATATPAPVGKPRPLSAVPRVTAGRGVTGAAGARSAPAALPSIEAQDEDEEQTRVASSSLLAGAFSQAVAAAPKPAPLEPASGLGDEWHVGINGVPVGPMRLNELRSKAASGAINKDSLVWQDGFEEWKPLSTFPELVAIVEESLSSTRAAPAPLVPAAAEPPKFAPAPLVISDPFAASAAPPPAAPSAGAVTGSALVTESPGDLGLALKRPSSSKAAWIAVVVALLCGLTIGFVVFSNQKPVVKIVEVPARTTAAPAAIPAPEPPPSATPIEEVTNVAAPRKGGGRAPAPAAPPPETKPPSRLTGLSGLQAGPQHGPVAGQAQERAATSQGLDGAMVERTVSRYTGSVKRRCWQPALDTRGKDAPSSARVSASITVGPSGAVQSVTSSGDPQGYHGLASCITSSIRSWQFPASSGTTTVNVPFVFASQ